MTFIIVFLSAGIGGALRHGVNLVARSLGLAFPFGTLAVNVSGSILMGMLAGHFALRPQVAQQWQLFLTTGVLGGFTTFSASSLDTALLLERGRPALAVVYVLSSMLLSIGGVFAGMAIMRSLARI